MKAWLLALALLPTAALAAALEDKVWNHGAEDCAAASLPPIEVFRFDATTYVLRQSKCVDFEAPFIYVLVGEHTAFVQDTGATEDAARFPLYETVRALVAGHGARKLLVTHSHSHGDHTAGDGQFRRKPGVTLVEPSPEAVRKHFGFASWPDGTATIDLGGRELRVVPIPGHHPESVAVYDARTGWLLTGDTVLPGYLYVDDWQAYRASIGRLVAFAKEHPVSAIVGTHVEMTRTPGKAYPRGTTYQPDEARLPLDVADLVKLDAALTQAGTEPREIVMEKFIVSPFSFFQRAVIKVLKWFRGS